MDSLIERLGLDRFVREWVLMRIVRRMVVGGLEMKVGSLEGSRFDLIVEDIHFECYLTIPGHYFHHILDLKGVRDNRIDLFGSLGEDSRHERLLKIAGVAGCLARCVSDPIQVLELETDYLKKNIYYRFLKSSDVDVHY